MTERIAPGVLPLEQARAVIEEHAARLRASGTETAALLESAGRVLAEDIRADRDSPPFPRATRDGYALRAADVSHIPASLQVVAEIRAGQPAGENLPELHDGQAAEIMTGAPLPAGADAVVMVEYTRRQGGEVVIERTVEPGDNFVAAGAEARAGDILLASGHRIAHAAIAVAASVGRSELRVFVRPRVAVLATGDEIVEIAAPPGPNQIRNSNTYSLAAQVRAAGADPVLLPVAPDERSRLRKLLLHGFNADLLLITGGVSMGKYDLVEQVLEELQAEFFFTGAQIQPGRPVVFGRCRRDVLHALTSPGASAPAAQADLKADGGATASQPRPSFSEQSSAPHSEFTYFLGLPGNPISTMVTFELFARPLVYALSGAPAGKLRFAQALLKSDVHVKTGLTRFLPAILSGEYHRAEVEPVAWHGSGDIAAQARANCYLVVPRDRDHLLAHTMVDVLLG